MSLSAIYDDAQVSAVEVKDAVERFCKIAAWVADSQIWASVLESVSPCIRMRSRIL